MKTVFKKIIDGEMPAEKVYETDDLIAIKDIYPKAPVHVLIIPKKEIPNLQSVNKEDLYLMGKIVEAAQDLANRFEIADAYRLITNNGEMAGQSIEHLHFHLMGGRKLDTMG